MTRSSNRIMLNRRALVGGMTASAATFGHTAAQPSGEDATFTLLVTNSDATTVTFIDPVTWEQEPVDVGPAPWLIAMDGSARAYVSTAQGITAIDLARRSVVETFPYTTQVGEPRFGEYRPGGMGIAVSPEGTRVYTGIYVSGQESWLEVLDLEQRAVIARVPIGIRPFDVLVSPDGAWVYALDHDSFTLTAVDAETFEPLTVDIAPLGYGGFDKPHYGVVREDGHLLLPFQGRVLLDLDPATWEAAQIEMTADTHQHGLALSAGGTRLYIAGTGPAGSATSGPSLAIVDLEAETERIIPLAKPHEMVALSPDESVAYLTGGYTFAGNGWDGITVVDLATGESSEIPVPGKPLDVVVISHEGKEEQDA